MKLIITLLNAVLGCPNIYIAGDDSSGCWTYDADGETCVVSNPSCVQISCTSDGKMRASLDPRLFGLEKEDMSRFVDGTEKLTLNDGSCQMIYDSVPNRFTLDETVTECASVASQTTFFDKSTLDFANTVSSSKFTQSFNTMDLLTRPKVEVTLVCSYPDTVSVSSDSYKLFEKATEFTIGVVTNKKSDPNLLDNKSPAFERHERDMIAMFTAFWKKYTPDTMPFEIKIQYFERNPDFISAENDMNVDVNNPTQERRSADDRTRDGGLGDVMIMTISLYFYVDEDKFDQDALKKLIIDMFNLWKKEPDTILNPDVTINPDDIDVAEVEPEKQYHKGTTVSHGSLDEGFELTIHGDDTYGDIIAKIPMGNTLFAKVEWVTPVAYIGFYLNSCAYSCGTDASHSVDIIKDTCYAEVVKTSLTNDGDKKLVSNTSTFSVQSFIFEGGEPGTCGITCAVKICAASLGCHKAFPDSCPHHQYLQYSRLGQRS